MRKGTAVTIAIFSMFMIFIGWAIAIQYILSQSHSTKLTAREANVIQAINKFEMLERSLENSIRYSYYQASNDVLSRGGYVDISSVQSFNCIPYLKINDQIYTTDFISNLEQLTENYLSEYSAELADDETTMPDFNIEFIPDSGFSRVEATSIESIRLYRKNRLEIEDSSNILVDVSDDFFAIQTLGLKIINENHIDEIVDASSDYNDFEERLENKRNELMFADYGFSSTFNLDLSSENVTADETNFVARVLVEISNMEEYPIYDFETGSNEMKPLELKYYILVSKNPDDVIIPETNTCSI